MKFAINACYGGFGISDEAFEWLIKNKNWKVTEYCEKGNHVDDSADIVESSRDLAFMGKYHFVECTSELKLRSNPDLIECIETLGEKASNRMSKVEVVECNEPIENLEIDEYDGIETLQTIPQRF